jgi:hypothetical protein
MRSPAAICHQQFAEVFPIARMATAGGNPRPNLTPSSSPPTPNAANRPRASDGACRRVYRRSGEGTEGLIRSGRLFRPSDRRRSTSHPLTQEDRTMGFPGLPAARTVEQAILLAQLQILRQMEKTRR